MLQRSPEQIAMEAAADWLTGGGESSDFLAEVILTAMHEHCNAELERRRVAQSRLEAALEQLEKISECFPDSATHKHPETGESLLDNVRDLVRDSQRTIIDIAAFDAGYNAAVDDAVKNAATEADAIRREIAEFVKSRWPEKWTPYARLCKHLEEVFELLSAYIYNEGETAVRQEFGDCANTWESLCACMAEQGIDGHLELRLAVDRMKEKYGGEV